MTLARGRWRSLRRADSLDPEGAPAWMRTVVKHGALASAPPVGGSSGPAEVDLDATEARELIPTDERARAEITNWTYTNVRRQIGPSRLGLVRAPA
jgi:hypothetical protein